MKYTVTYSCGHSGTVELFGPERDRERKLEWYRDSAVCPECYARQQTEERAAIESQSDMENQFQAARKFLCEMPEEKFQEFCQDLTESQIKVLQAERFFHKLFSDKLFYDTVCTAIAEVAYEELRHS